MNAKESPAGPLSCCGLDCENCDVRLATVNGDEELRERTARLWQKLNNNPSIIADLLFCEGCLAQGVKTLYCTDICAIRRCALGRGYAACSDCAALESCPTLAAITQHMPEALSRLRQQAAQEDR